jgi:pimeloyl-ACP methyl ester carboxylesterase
MAILERREAIVRGRSAGILHAGSGPSPVIFIHGGIAGTAPYCSGSHVWGPVLEHFATRWGVIAVDLPGHGRTVPGTGALTVDGLSEWATDLFEVLQVSRCFVVGHDFGGLLALQLAARHPAIVAGVTVVSSGAAAPTGDGVENLVLAHPPKPLWSRSSQHWAFEQLSYSPHHITGELLNACVKAGERDPHRSTAEFMRNGGLDTKFLPTLAKAKAKLYELCRTHGIPVPVQVIWGSHDRLSPLEQGLWLFRLVAAKQSAAHFHVINRTGSFPFREDPQTFSQLVDSFCEGILAEQASKPSTSAQRASALS